MGSAENQIKRKIEETEKLMTEINKLKKNSEEQKTEKETIVEKLKLEEEKCSRFETSLKSAERVKIQLREETLNLEENLKKRIEFLEQEKTNTLRIHEQKIQELNVVKNEAHEKFEELKNQTKVQNENQIRIWNIKKLSLEDEIKNLKNENNTTQRKHLEIKNDFDEKLRSEVSTCAGLKVGRAILMRQIHCHQKSE